MVKSGGPGSGVGVRVDGAHGPVPDGDAGFTLIEIMVVLLILAILLAIAIPTFLGVTGSANDRAVQSNANTALTSLKAQATQAGQSYAGLTAAAMKGYEPSLNWSRSTTATAATVGTQGPVAYYVSADGKGVVVVTYSTAAKSCWYAADNLGAVVDTVGPYGATAVPSGDATDVPTAVGTWYAKAGTNSSGTCDPAVAPVGATSPWVNRFSAA